MSITTKIKLRPFTVPNFVTPESPSILRDKLWESASIRLADLEDETIEALLAQFRDDVWAKVVEDRKNNQELTHVR